MSRQARIKSPSSIYHVMNRGIDKQDIFKEGYDYDLFERIITELNQEMDTEIYAYCLMNNHVHFLLKEKEDSISLFMKRLTVKYALWFNKKYDRVGHLFQGRFKSEAIDSQEYFLAAIRYVHMNPVKAGICLWPEDYPYSSYRNYFQNPLIAKEEVSEIISEVDFFALHKENQRQELSLIDVDNQEKRIREKDAKTIMNEHCFCDTPEEFQELSKKEIRETIGALLKNGANLHQISKITGVSRYVLKKEYQK